MYSPIRRNTRKQGNKYKRFRQKIVFVKSKKNRQEIIKEEGSKEEADVKKLKKLKNGYADLKRHHQIFGPCFSYNPHYGVVVFLPSE